MDEHLMKKTTNSVTVVQPHMVAGASSDYINSSSREYAIYTAQNRAIPSSCDGLKDGQRKMLWLMRNKSEKVKTISLAGSVIQEGIYLHGDVSASDTISRLAAPYLNNIPLFEGLGAFGTRVSPDGWGAPRYTYVKKSKAAELLLYPDLDIVPLKPNYDGSVMEPANFLPLIPLTLLNGMSGIAVGWSTEILPHSLKDIVSATLAVIDGNPVPELMPQFDYLQTTVKSLGHNAYEFVGKITIEGDNLVRVTELPPDMSLEKFKARLNQMEDDDQIHSYTDRSTKLINIEIKFKRGVISGKPATTEIVNGKKVKVPAVAAWTEADAITFFKLKSKTTQRIVVLDFNNTSIRQYDRAEDLVKAFVNWRLTYYALRYTKMRDDLLRELNLACGIQACLKGGLPKWLPTADNKAAVEAKVRELTVKIDLRDDQIERIVSLPTYRWAKDAIEKIQGEIEELSEKIVEYESILADPKKIRAVYRQEVAALQNLKI
jgi:DNA gyrase/topoisomerase IV subunit A